VNRRWCHHRAMMPVLARARFGPAMRAGAVLMSAASLWGTIASGQTPGALTVAVVDPSNAVMVSASVTLAPASHPAKATVRLTDAAGEAQFDVQVGRTYRLRVEATGFSPHELDVHVEHPAIRQLVRLALAPVAVDVLVRRDPDVAATDPRGLAFKRVLTERDLAALPDDPEALEEALRAIAGPGALFRVDGFRGSQLPPKSAIQEVRISYSDFSAEYHAYTRAVVDILTKPGIERFYGSFSVQARPSAWSARDAFAERRSRAEVRTYEGTVGGPLWRQRTSFLAALTVAMRDVEEPVHAAGPNGPIRDLVAQTSTNTRWWGSVVHLIGRGQTTRVRYADTQSRAENLGVGGLALGERAVDRTATERTLQSSLTGSLGTRMFNQLRMHVDTHHQEQEAVSDRPAINVMGAFESGGAQVGGGRRQTAWSIQDDVDLTLRNHAIRIGGDVETITVRSDEWRNRSGTYTFASVADYAAWTPLTFTQRVGDPSVSLTVRHGALYVQDDVRLGKRLMISGGLRAEGQSKVRGWRVGPRFGLSWSPFVGGRTAVRIGIGRYYDWIPATVLEQAARLNGSRQREVVVVHPGGTGNPVSERGQPPERYELAPDVTLGRNLRFLTAIDQQLGGAATLALLYQEVRGSRLLRGTNLNAPVDGAGRPDGTWGNVIQAQSVGRRHQRSLSIQVNWRAPAPLDLLVLGDYVLGSVRDDTDGPFAVPANPFALDTEWGPAHQDARHQWSLSAIVQSGSRCYGSLFVSGATGTPYTVRTGLDDNGDGLLTDRPRGVVRNSQRGGGYVMTSGRIACRPFRRASSRNAVGAGRRAPVFEVSADAQNLFNRTNSVGYVGVMTSPLFGQPVGALPARRVSVRLSIRF